MRELCPLDEVKFAEDLLWGIERGGMEMFECGAGSFRISEAETR